MSSLTILFGRNTEYCFPTSFDEICVYVLQEIEGIITLAYCKTKWEYLLYIHIYSYNQTVEWDGIGSYFIWDHFGLDLRANEPRNRV